MRSSSLTTGWPLTTTRGGINNATMYLFYYLGLFFRATCSFHHQSIHQVVLTETELPNSLFWGLYKPNVSRNTKINTKMQNVQLWNVWIKTLHTSCDTNLRQKHGKTNLHKSFDRTLLRFWGGRVTSSLKSWNTVCSRRILGCQFDPPLQMLGLMWEEGAAASPTDHRYFTMSCF